MDREAEKSNRKKSKPELRIDGDVCLLPGSTLAGYEAMILSNNAQIHSPLNDLNYVEKSDG